MENFEYYNPVRILFGPGMLNRVGDEATHLGKTALLVSYRMPSSIKPILVEVTKMLEEKGLNVIPFFEITANPLLNQIQDGVETAKQSKADFVIAVGGGSAMDAAKIIAAGFFYDGNPWNMIVKEPARTSCLTVQYVPIR